MLLFWLGLVIYGSLKLRTYILIARDQVWSIDIDAFICWLNLSAFIIQQGVKDKFRFSTFCLQYVTYLVQFVLSVILEPNTKSNINAKVAVV